MNASVRAGRSRRAPMDRDRYRSVARRTGVKARLRRPLVILDVGLPEEGPAMPDDVAHAHCQIPHQRGIGVGIAALSGPHQRREARFVGFLARHP